MEVIENPGIATHLVNDNKPIKTNGNGTHNFYPLDIVSGEKSINYGTCDVTDDTTSTSAVFQRKEFYYSDASEKEQRRNEKIPLRSFAEFYDVNSQELRIGDKIANYGNGEMNDIGGFLASTKKSPPESFHYVYSDDLLWQKKGPDASAQ
jgi:hypothetical protein